MVRKSQHARREAHRAKPTSGNNHHPVKVQRLVDDLLKITTRPFQGGSQAWELQKALGDALQALQRLERDAVDISGSRHASAAIDRFANWARANGAESDSVRISSFPGYGLGLEAGQDIGKESLIVSVPRKIMLTLESARKSALGKGQEGG